jgi:hypothetical protein
MSRQTNRSKASLQLPPIRQPTTETQPPDSFDNLLRVGGLHINTKKLEAHISESKSTVTSGRKKSHKSLGTHLANKMETHSFKIRPKKKAISTEGILKSEAKEQAQS